MVNNLPKVPMNKRQKGHLSSCSLIQSPVSCPLRITPVFWVVEYPQDTLYLVPFWGPKSHFGGRQKPHLHVIARKVGGADCRCCGDRAMRERASSPLRHHGEGNTDWSPPPVVGDNGLCHLTIRAQLPFSHLTRRGMELFSASGINRENHRCSVVFHLGRKAPLPQANRLWHGLPETECLKEPDVVCGSIDQIAGSGIF